MNKRIGVLALLAVLLVAVLTATACTKEDGKTSTSTSTEAEKSSTTEPKDTTSAAGEAVLEGTCTECHDVTRIYVQPYNTDWDAVIADMETAHDAVLTEDEKVAVAEFLGSRTLSEGEKVVTGKCGECHDVRRIWQQPYDADWTSIVKRMVEVHGAVLTEEEQAAAVAFLEGR